MLLTTERTVFRGREDRQIPIYYYKLYTVSEAHVHDEILSFTKIVYRELGDGYLYMTTGRRKQFEQSQLGFRHGKITSSCLDSIKIRAMVKCC